MSGARDFTLAKYEELCRAVVEAGYPALSMTAYVEGAPAPPAFVLLRHDVETSPALAVRMAEIESRHRLSATYFLRARRRGFPAAEIARLRALGHDVGYHYETLARARGDAGRAAALFARDLEDLRRHGPVRLASMHGSPLFPWDNRDLWRTARPADFGLAGEVYADIDYADVRYFSDTGRTWHPTRHNLRDHVAVRPEAEADSTDDLIGLLRARRFPRLCLLAHPDRWSASTLAWMGRAGRDWVENGIKDALGRLHRRRTGSARA